MLSKNITLKDKQACLSLLCSFIYISIVKQLHSTDHLSFRKWKKKIQTRYFVVVFCSPNFEEVEEECWFGPVRPSVRPSVSYTCTRSGMVRARILKFYI